MIAIAAMFHNAEGYAARYAAQVAALRQALPGPSRLILAHAGCTDGTPELLAALMPDAALLDRTDPALPVVPRSIDHPARWLSIAHTANGAIEQLTEADDALVWVESDLLWEPGAILRLLGHLGPGVDGAAAMCGYLPEGGRHYDTWGNRGLDGVCFGYHPPYHPAAPPRGLFPVASAGSCWAVRGDYARAARYGDQGIRDWCHGMRAAGAQLFVDLDTWVWHP